MAVFFLLVGLEIKREILQGELSSRETLMLPGIAAVGGVVLPALIYAVINVDDPTALRGWAIPAATDIAFALGVLSLLGSRVPVSLKVFLTALAIIDDVAAVVIIALFYTGDISLPFLAWAVAGVALLCLFNWLRVQALWPYLVVGAVVWLFVLKSGLHATLAGVVLAFLVPLDRTAEDEDEPPLLRLEHGAARFRRLPGGADLRLRQCRRLLRRRQPVQLPRAGAARHRRRPRDRQVARRRRRRLGVDPPRLRGPAGRGDHGPARRRLGAGRDRLHHEPVHRLAGLRGSRRCRRRPRWACWPGRWSRRCWAACGWSRSAGGGRCRRGDRAGD